MRSYRTQALKSVRGEMSKRHTAAGFVLENAMKKKIVEYQVIDTGRTLASVTSDADGDGVVAGTNLKYARFPALGTRYVEPRNWPVDGTIGAIPTLRDVYGGKPS